MREAVNKALERSMEFLKVSKEYEVPRTTLEARVKKVRSGELSLESSHGIRLGKFKTVFAPAQEDKLVKHILAMEARDFLALY